MQKSISGSVRLARLITTALLVAMLPAGWAEGQSSVGERIYKGKCANCHSVDGSASSELGRKLGLRDLRSPEVQAMSDSDLRSVITKGRRGMPSFDRHYKDDQLADLVRYIRSLRQMPAAETTANQSPH